jgi:hypothetical protein
MDGLVELEWRKRIAEDVNWGRKKSVGRGIEWKKAAERI